MSEPVRPSGEIAAERYLPEPPPRRKGTALCLSGGGFRATLFHLGALRRLNELGLLHRIDAFVSVSGGSVLNGVLARRWSELKPGPEGGPSFVDFDTVVEERVRAFCRKDLRTEVLLWSRANPLNLLRTLGDDHSVTDLLADAYARHLDLGGRLRALSPTRRFIFSAANLETGANWEFDVGPERSEMGDYVVGRIGTGDTTLAHAVAASSAFPPAFPPLVLRFPDPGAFQFKSRDFPDEARRAVPLTDGGVYDNLGLEPVWKSFERVLVSNAGSPFELKDDPGNDLTARVLRSFGIVSRQSEALRTRWLIGLFLTGKMQGAYWSLRSDVANYGMPGAPGYPVPLRRLIEQVRTDLDAFTDGEIGCLENHGYALSSVACAKWLSARWPGNGAAFAWPWPDVEPAQADAVVRAVQNSGQRGVVGDLLRSALDKIRA